jgi:hypothetical protein
MPSGLFQSMGAMTAFHDVFNAALAPPGFSALCCVPAAWFAAQISAATARRCSKRKLHFKCTSLIRVRMDYEFVSCLGDFGMVEKRTAFAGLS